jgi:hypothetical protein
MPVSPAHVKAVHVKITIARHGPAAWRRSSPLRSRFPPAAGEAVFFFQSGFPFALETPAVDLGFHARPWQSSTDATPLGATPKVPAFHEGKPVTASTRDENHGNKLTEPQY